MRKWLKILLIVILIIFILIIAFVGFTVYNGYNYYKFYNEAENLGSFRFGSDLFNSKIAICEESYGGQTIGESWEIRGLENNKCIIIYNKPIINDECYNNPEICNGKIEINYVIYVCELPQQIYRDYQNLAWSELLDGEYCNSN